MSVKTFGDEQRRQYLQEHRTKGSTVADVLIVLVLAALLWFGLALPRLFPSVFGNQVRTTVIVNCE
jgi:hypothetical protein